MESKEKGFMDTRDDNQIILTTEENKILEQLNIFAEKSRKEAIKQTAFYNLSLKQLLDKFLSTWNNIINEIMNLHKMSYEKNHNYWWNNIKQLLISINGIITKEDRLIYVGLMLIIISFFLYFLLISS
jgi:hypothetical protein